MSVEAVYAETLSRVDKAIKTDRSLQVMQKRQKDLLKKVQALSMQIQNRAAMLAAAEWKKTLGRHIQR